VTRSLHFQLTAGILAAVLIIVSLAGWFAYTKIESRLYAEFDDNLIQRARSISKLIEYDPEGIDVDWLEDHDHPPGHQEGIDFVHVVDTNGHTLTVTEGIETSDLWKEVGSLDVPVMVDIHLSDGSPGRAVTMAFVPLYDPEVEDETADDELGEADDNEALFPLDIEAPMFLAVAKRNTVAAPLASMRKLFWIVLLCAGTAVMAAIWLVVRKALDPLNSLKSEIVSLDDAVGHQRVYVDNPPKELEPVVEELNILLGRVEQAMKREKRLTSGLAHELRTPVSGLLSSLEVTLSRPRKNEAYRESAEECFEIAKQMHWLVTNLLSLSRIEAGNVEMQSDIVRLKESLLQWWSPFETAAAQKGISIEWIIDPDAKLETDPEFLRVVITNLFDNAICYAPENTSIRIKATAGGIWVENEAIDLSPEAVENVFEAFWRKPGIGNDASPHAGLGLNLCKRIAELLGGTITASIEEQGSIFQIRLSLS
jgi:signal transduction histidine kinase